MTSRQYQICTRCVMDTTDSVITFDDGGVCDHCQTFDTQIKPNWNIDDRSRAELGELVSKIKQSGKGKEFDCIIGVSGGIDSSYLTWLAKHEFGLRPLVFHVDAGWNSQEAVNNIETLIDHLELDLYTYVIDWEEMRDLQLAYFKSGVPHIDTPQDHAFFATMYKFASDNNVSYILTGANYSTECIRNPIEWMYYQSDSIQLRDIHRRFGSRPLDKFPTTSILRHKIYLPYIKGIKVVRPLNYIPYIGSTIAVFAAAVIALLQFGLGYALVAISGLVVIQQLLGNVVDPRLAGRSLEISPIVVLVSIVFWGWVWGLVGTLIGVLLTATLVIVFEHIPALRPVAVLLSRRASDVSPG